MPSPERQSAKDLFPQVYDELKRVANQRVADDPAAQSLNATALVHEAFLRLDGHEFNDRGHLAATASEVMRRILIDQARSRGRQKRGGGEWKRVEFAESQIVAPTSDETLLQVDEALAKLEESDPDCADLVKMRFFSGFSLQEIAELTGISYSTVKRRWAYAKTWLTREIGRQLSEPKTDA